MTKRIVTEDAVCSLCRWWKANEYGDGYCAAHDYISYWDDSCRCFARSRMPRKYKKMMARRKKRAVRIANEDGNLPF